MAVDDEILALVRAGRKVEAIKTYRQRYGSDLLAAKLAVEAMGQAEAARAAAVPTAGFPAVPPGGLDPGVVRQIENFIAQRQPIHAIKLLREHTSLGLKEAKEMVDRWVPGSPPPGLLAAPPAAAAEDTSPDPGSYAAAAQGLDFSLSDATAFRMPPIPSVLEEDLAGLLSQGRKIDAIKLYRERTGCDLNTAKDAVEAREQPAARATAASSAAASVPRPQVDSHDRECVEAVDRNIGQGIDLALKLGRKDEAIRLYQERYNVDAGEARRVVEARERETRLEGGQVKSGCFIATAAFGAADASEVMLLRRYRDRVLARSAAGRCFIECYYRLSPPLARLLSRTEAGRAAVRVLLRPLVSRLRSGD